MGKLSTHLGCDSQFVEGARLTGLQGTGSQAGKRERGEQGGLQIPGPHWNTSGPGQHQMREGVGWGGCLCEGHGLGVVRAQERGSGDPKLPILSREENLIKDISQFSVFILKTLTINPTQEVSLTSKYSLQAART